MFTLVVCCANSALRAALSSEELDMSDPSYQPLGSRQSHIIQSRNVQSRIRSCIQHSRLSLLFDREVVLNSWQSQESLQVIISTNMEIGAEENGIIVAIGFGT